MKFNDQIWRMAMSSLESRKIVKLPNPHNSIHDALRFASQNPEVCFRLADN
jgi:hypothetical protein